MTTNNTMKRIQVVANGTLIAEVGNWKSAVRIASQHPNVSCFVLLKGNDEGDITLIRWYIPESTGIRVETTLNKG